MSFIYGEQFKDVMNKSFSVVTKTLSGGDKEKEQKLRSYIYGSRVYKTFIASRTSNYNSFLGKFICDDYIQFGGVKLPYVAGRELEYVMSYKDIFMVYCEYNDDYSADIINRIEPSMPEGPYLYYESDTVRIDINENDIVIDCGAWIGDFSAYAAMKGAKVFAFEPDEKNILLLEKTRDLNQLNFKIIQKGVSSKTGKSGFEMGNNVSLAGAISDTGATSIDVITLDQFKKDQGIEKIEFIKADIEGHERFMLLGAENILRTDEPILSICTYHLPDDPQVLKEIILKFNPKYKIIQRSKKLYAYVPKTDRNSNMNGE